ncbi:MAG: hypothetical protein V1797_08505 [Pseudomonadota bacterium]
MAELWWLLLAADGLLIAAVALLLIRLRRGGGLAGGQVPDLAGFLAEADRLAKEFDRLLADKRELVSATLRGIDQRVAELEDLRRELDQREAKAQAAVAAAPAPAAEPAAAGDQAEFRQRVLLLARQGQDAGQIAAATGRPRGEVELVLGLNGQNGSAREA